uniref:MFS domain-containing protein n=1 Tax=Syphacia muris TaxID=451379 RepID=A0A0N5ALQ1_9BILA
MLSATVCLLTIALCLSGGFHQGYIANVLNQPYVAIEQFINQSWIERYNNSIKPNNLNLIWSALNVLFPIAGIFGQFLAAVLCHNFGRKQTAIISSLLYFPGIGLSFATKQYRPHFELLFIGRFIWSLANGILTVTATVWIVECVPTKHRGRMASLQEVFMAAGSLSCQIAGMMFSTEELWPNIFIPPIIISLIAVAIFSLTHDSPQFIIDHKQDVEKARNALVFYHGGSDNSEKIDAELKVCLESLVEKSQKHTEHTSKKVTHLSSLTVMFKPAKADDPKSQVIRTAAWLGVLIKIAYVLTGSRCLRAYSTFVLHHMSKWDLSTALILSCCIGFMRLPFTFVPVILVEKVGRRPLIIGSMLMSLIAQIVLIGCIHFGSEWKIGSFIALTTLLLVNACGLGSVSRFYSAELVPRSLLINSVSLLTAAEGITKVTIEFAFFPIAHINEAYSLLLFAIPTAVLTMVVWYFCPETKGKAVNDVLNTIAQRQKIKATFANDKIPVKI